MHVHRLKISGLRGIESADISFGKHSVLVGPNNNGKTTIVEALALLLGRDRLVRRLTEHDFHKSRPIEASRILIIATVTGFPENDPQHSPSWFAMGRGGVEKWLNPNTGSLAASADDQHTELSVQIAFSARFDLQELEAETVRFFVDDEATLGDPFHEDTVVTPISSKTLQELGFFMVPASRTWDKWISFTSELFRRLVATLGGLPATAIRDARARLWEPEAGQKLEEQDGLTTIVELANDELGKLMPSSPRLQLRITGTDSNSVLESVIPHFAHGNGPTLPSARQGTGLTSLQSLLLLMQFGKARADANKSFVLAVEEPELHIQPSQQKRLVNRLNALCDQTIVTTHSPLVAAMFPVEATYFVDNKDGQMSVSPLSKTAPAGPSNHKQHLFFAWRQKLIAALMHQRVLIPEGISDVAWLETLQTALELRQSWNSPEDEQSKFATFVGVVPTDDAKISETHEVVKRVHHHCAILVDGDPAGRGYLTELNAADPSPSVAIIWPTGWKIEHVVTWVAEANIAQVLPQLAEANASEIRDAAELSAFLESRKSYAPTQEITSAILMGEAACRKRAAQLLNALCNILLDPSAQSSPLFVRETEDGAAMPTFRFEPPNDV
ncbi:ATP-dependent nuclease [Rhodovulum sp. FJ3]|uniref:ATP-dependent nuclease n=1 Tax=Rhodovulum sp. FJ3 TaxID=3079053 RepID=UPI00293DCF48|nr:AAA family ATPase [Rhodovulum sp. FJ3]MDV4169687.1 AAA family ATPase [Rhodovulum sp. FJ3]